jgi:formylglycine-generating enzyme required for sulfatase activity
MPRKIFISYRRDDVAGDARGLRDALAARFGNKALFMDVDDLKPGQRFDEKLAEALDQSSALIVVIGPRWVSLLNERSDRKAADYVRKEIAAALQRRIPVVPVLIGHSGRMPAMPSAKELPDEIQDLTLYHKHDVAHESFRRDVAVLIKVVEKLLEPRVPLSLKWAAGVLVLAAAIYSAVLIDLYPLSRRVTPEVATVPKPIMPVDLATGGETSPEVKPIRITPDRSALVQPGSGQTFSDCSGCPEMVVVPVGSFMMGSSESDDESPVHPVQFGRTFAVSKCEITFDEWNVCAQARGCAANPRPRDEGWGTGRRPVINVSLSDARSYVNWIAATTGRQYRLLSEAEWEYAARARSTTRYAFGDSITGRNAQFSPDRVGSATQTAEVGSFAPNAWGIHDMHGNVREWVEDNWHPNYTGAPNDGSVWRNSDTTFHIVRGGSWFDFNASYLRSASRKQVEPSIRSSVIGFRVARSL